MRSPIFQIPTRRASRESAIIKSVEIEKGLLENCLPEKRVEQEGDCAVLVPSGESLEPFVRFFSEKGAAEGGLQIWIANMEKGTIDPHRLRNRPRS